MEFKKKKNASDRIIFNLKYLYLYKQMIIFMAMKHILTIH